MPKQDNDYRQYIDSRSHQPPPTLYKYVPIDTAKLILASKNIRFQSPLLYNDPFDVQWDLMWPLSLPEADRHEASVIEYVLRNPIIWPQDSDPVVVNAITVERFKIQLLPKNKREQLFKNS